MILIENTQTHIFGIQQVAKDRETPQSLALKPGINRVDPAVWATLQSNPLIQAYIKRGDLRLQVVDTLEQRLDPEKYTGSLSAVTTREAQKIIRNTFDPALLREWKETDERSVIGAYVDAQLKRISLEDELESEADEG